jgi:hypothetical protein
MFVRNWLRASIEKKRSFYRRSIDFRTRDVQNVWSGFRDVMTKLGFRTIETKRWAGVCSDETFVSDSGVAYIRHGGEDDVDVKIYSCDLTAIKSVEAYVESVDDPKPPSGSVFMACSRKGEIVFRPIGAERSELEPQNYRSDVIEDYDYIKENLSNSNPNGRISILDGVPGTGKTYLVRSLVTSSANVTFVLVPSDMVESLVGPSLITALMQLKDSYEDSPICLIVEDADKYLVPRASDNVSAISTILNLSDGILGSIIDIRIVCTTNAEIDRVDPAILRPGRLCRRVEVGRLDSDQSSAIYERLTSKPNHYKSGFRTLAEIYQDARGGQSPEIKASNESSKIGFWAK